MQNGGWPSQSATMENSLFVQIGGTEAITRLVATFYTRVLSDPELKHFFKDVEMAKLRRMQVEMFSAALGGPQQYTGRPMIKAHRHLKIGLQDYQRFVRHLFDTLDDAGFGLSEQERYEVVGRLNILTNEVMSGGTGLAG